MFDNPYSTGSWDAFLSRCVSIDLEVDPKAARVFAFAAVEHMDAPPLVFRKGDPAWALDRLGVFCSRAEHIIGHNILRHDLPHLLASAPQLAKLTVAPIDTLWLNPLAFPQNPYHRLVKHYQDGRLEAGHVNDPELDARLVFEVLAHQLVNFSNLNAEQPDALVAYHYLTTRGESSAGFDAVFSHVRRAPTPSSSEAHAAICRLLTGNGCELRIDQTLRRLSDPRLGWPMAYALSWISVAGGDSVMPPWVRMQFPEAALIVRHVRDTGCENISCRWCREKNDPKRALMRWFGFEAFRSEPADEAGRPLQERIVAEAMVGKSVLGILPTGTGKSVCYQVPALSRFDKTGALTVVISPLVALMADQVQGLVRTGISSAVTVNGMLSLPERHDALEKVRLGDAAILLISPEQLRSSSIRSVLKQREVGLWVMDEAHCISNWGHDFRPDYRYVGRFIKEFSGDMSPAPVLCLTATAKPEVVRDIREYFKSRLGLDLLLLDGGAVRTNLSFAVRPTQQATKLGDILDAIEDKLPAEGASGAVVYCATRGATERVAEFLKQQGLAAERYHAGLSADEKRDVQERFRIGELRIIAATNAFGMGIDKPDIRLVVHGDIPGSLENYLQEAGRAGRDRAPADCVLLFQTEDVERQFTLSARSRLARHEIGAILKALRRIDTRTRKNGQVVATSGEIVREETDQEFERDSATDDTRVRTALAWLEEARLLAREENRVHIFPSSLRIRTLEEAAAIIERAGITGTRKRQLVDIVRHVINTPADEGISTDVLSGASGLAGAALRKALVDLEALGIASNDTILTVFIHHAVHDSSSAQLEQAGRLETDLIALLREEAPDADGGEPQHLNLRLACQRLRDCGHATVRPDIIERLIRSLAQDGRDQDGGRGSLGARKVTRDTIQLRLHRPWPIVEKTAALRRQGGQLLLDQLLACLPKGARGKDILVETTLGAMLAHLNGDIVLRSSVQDMSRLMDRALLWMHEQQIVVLGKGLTVFRPAMTVHLDPKGGSFTLRHFQPLEEHYQEQTLQTHVMAAYAETGLTSIERAQLLSQDYFMVDRDVFLKRWMAGRGQEVRQQTTGRSWATIVDALDNPVQEQIVRDDREQTNVLVLAGPGSGKTRVLVHRIAYLVRVKRENPNGILVLTYNRHAATEIRERLGALIGDDARGVAISTCHALAMRLIGASFTSAQKDGDPDFDRCIVEAVRLLRGDGLSKVEAEALRSSLTEGYRWILVDEYQDIGPEEYALIAAIAGRTLDDPDQRLSLFAVGDDDQNIYGFAGASIRFIRRFEEDYAAKPVFLTENYRSTSHIIEAGNAVLSDAKGRMKEGHDICVDRHRADASQGGIMAALDPVAQGRVQLLTVRAGNEMQAMAAVDELVRLSRLVPDWSWRRAAIIARDWRRLEPVRSYAESLSIPVQTASESAPSLWRLRELQHFIGAIRREPGRLFNVQDLEAILHGLSANRWTELIADGIGALARELGPKAAPVPDLVEWFAEWARDTRASQRGLLLLTAHRAKGLEFDDVVILNGGWDRIPKRDSEDADAERRLFYVAMTRARRSLAAMSSGRHPFLNSGMDCIISRIARPDPGALPQTRLRYVLPNPKLVDLSFAGRFASGNPTLSAVAAAKVGDAVTLVRERDRWALCNDKGEKIGRMSRAFEPPEGTTLLRGEIGAILHWRKDDSDDAYLASLKRETWEVVLPELVFTDG